MARDQLSEPDIRAICLNGIILGFVKARSDVPIITKMTNGLGDNDRTFVLDNGQMFSVTVKEIESQ